MKTYNVSCIYIYIANYFIVLTDKMILILRRPTLQKKKKKDLMYK